MAWLVVTFGALVTFLVSFVTVWYLYYQYCFTYWKRRNLATKQPVFPAGNLTPILLGQENVFVVLQNLYNEFKRKGLRHAGMYSFNGPIYFPIDPVIIKRIMVTDFEYFMDRGVYCNEQKAPLTTHLFCLSGNKWRQLRAKLTPAFSSAKLKTMYNHVFLMHTQALIEKLRTFSDTGSSVDTKKLIQAYTMDIIASTAFGLQCDILNGRDSYIMDLLHGVTTPSTWKLIRTLLIDGMQNLGILLKVSQDNKEVEKFFRRIINDTIAHRKKNNINCDDFLTILMNISKEVGLSENEIIAQAFVFFLGGFETSSTVISCCIHELAHNQHIQQRLRDEVVNILGKNYTEYKYDGVVRLPYLDKVLKETMRLYPVAGVLNRIVVKDYKVPNTDVVLEKGTPVIISTLGLQRDPEYYPDPLKFDPERFNDGDNIVPYTYLPFGDGPRFCIGTRYGSLETKLAIAAIVSQYKILPSEKTPAYLEFDKVSKSLFLCRSAGFFVKFQTL